MNNQNNRKWSKSTPYIGIETHLIGQKIVVQFPPIEFLAHATFKIIRKSAQSLGDAQKLFLA